MKRLLSLLLLSVSSLAAALPEPDVVFYGRVLHRGGGEEYLMTSGTLTWQVDPLSPTQYSSFRVDSNL